MNSISEKAPRIAKLWHPTLNGSLLPSEVPAGTKKPKWWICPKDHEWEARPCDMTRRPNVSPCPFCAGRRIIVGFNDLASQYPAVASQWHPEKNGTLLPTEVSYGSGKKIWWKDPSCNHEWERVVAERTTKSSNCPYCSRTVVLPGFNDLATEYPEIAELWHPSKNGIEANQIFAGNKKKRWWLGKCGHEWEASAANMTKNGKTGTGCPYCCGKKVMIGNNDILTILPEVTTIWDYEKNTLSPTEITVSSAKIVHWKCSGGHEWFSPAHIQTRHGVNCPFCSGRQVFAGLNDFATTHPEMAAQWHPTKNGNLLPTAISYGASMKVWWQCSLGHEWDGVVAGRTTNNTWCPVCSGQRFIPGINDLATVNPAMAAEWHPTKNGNLRPEDVQRGTNKSVWWQCKLMHEWKVSINSRSKYNAGCPYCTNTKILPGFNDFATTHPILMTEWHPNKNSNLDPYSMAQWSGKQAWWVGTKCGHEWQASILSRKQGHGCTVCNKKGSSQTERDLFAALKVLIPDTQHNVGLDAPWGKNQSRARVDIFIPSLLTVVEYDGSWWHRNKFTTDTQKTTALIAAGYKVIRVRAKPLEFLDMKDDNLLQIVHDKEGATELADIVFESLLN